MIKNKPNIPLVHSILQIQLIGLLGTHEDSSLCSEITWYTVLVRKIVHLGFTWQVWLLVTQDDPTLKRLLIIKKKKFANISNTLYNLDFIIYLFLEST